MKILVSKKKSGNIVISTCRESAWEDLTDCTTPKELFDFIKNLERHKKIIMDSSSSSQLSCYVYQYTERDALKAFGFSYKEREKYFA